MTTVTLDIRLCDADRDRWPAPGDGWLTYDHDQVLDTPADVLDEWEQQIGCSLESIIAEVGQETARAWRVLAWLAYQQAGVDLPWREFRPRTLRMRTRPTPASGDADPPDGSSSTVSGLDSDPG